ncbi:NAD-dependent epimerase/dehydratase family protein [Amycolatopsis nigrescens]|uniref:NAD-dependent epimerase/dehydratase family protein n=1 Tax=Amycolatopsis nigrescens TaxID=381445 RepID=UPI0003A8134E|nr:NAD-dependent epimerase/dehydratase family protein [Amycolatopsis nigrescens]
MELLLLGGTGFVGRAIVDDALARGWQVSMFNRGRRRPPEGVTFLRGDRTAPCGLASLERGRWDVVVDTWTDAPLVVRDAARALAGRVGRYVYVSSRSVYVMPTPPGATEQVPLVEAAPDDGEVEYARAKAGGELAVTAAFGDRALFPRAGLILGPYEDVGRLTWWLSRIARGGRVLAPGPPGLELQYIDVRDLAAWTLDAAERGLGGAYNLVSPPGHTTMRELLESCVDTTGADAELCWTEPEPILAAGVEPWTDLPVWLPPGETYQAMHRSNVSKAVAAGLNCRPVTETVAGTWSWMRGLGGAPPQRADRPTLGLDPGLEAKLVGGGKG